MSKQKLDENFELKGVSCLRDSTSEELDEKAKLLGIVLDNLAPYQEIGYWADCISRFDRYTTHDGDHYPTFHDNYVMTLEAGENAYIEVNSTLFDPSRPNGMIVHVNNASITLPLDSNIQHVHNYTMILAKAVEELKDAHPIDARNSDWYKIKIICENALKAYAKKDTEKLKEIQDQLLTYIAKDPKLFAGVQAKCEHLARIRALIHEKRLAKETRFKKYSRSPEKFEKALPTLLSKHKFALAKQEHRAFLKNKKISKKLKRNQAIKDRIALSIKKRAEKKKQEEAYREPQL